MRRHLFPIVLAVSLAGLAPAGAGTLDDLVNRPIATVGNSLGSLWGFLGSSAPETGQAPAPDDAAAAEPMRPQPVPVRLMARPGLIPSLADIRLPTLAAANPVTPVAAAWVEPSVEKTAKKLFCVEYARAISGLNIFGDAKTWWAHAKNLYARASQPLEQAVMVFSGSRRLKKGHVAVVTEIVSAREIRVEQANWMNKGEIDHATPVLDVSPRNDWSKVRVWDVPSHQFGARVYAISGFILKPGLVRQAAND